MFLNPWQRISLLKIININQIEIAEELSVTKGTISKWKNKAKKEELL